MEQEIINILNSRGLDKIYVEVLIDLGDEPDWDGELVAITCNTIAIENGKVIIYDDNNEDWDGSVEDEDKYFFSNLDEYTQKEVMFSLNFTLKNGKI